MGKDKLRRFRENESFPCLVQPGFEELFGKDYRLKGRWKKDFFGNSRPLVLELGCGRGEYTVGLARMYPDRNFLGLDIKGARLWRGAKTAAEEPVPNAGFVRTRIELIDSLFAEGEVDDIWITFPDPQLKKSRIRKRLTGPLFLSRYARFLTPGGSLHLKTDSLHLHEYTRAVIEANGLRILCACPDIYGTENRTGFPPELTGLKTTYESRYLSERKPITYLRFALDGRRTFVEPAFAPDEGLDKDGSL